MRISDQEANRLQVLKAIRRAEPVARTDLTRLTGLSSATISEITGEFLDRGFLLEAKAPATGRGRPRLQLLLRPDAAYVAGAFLMSAGELAVEISNARGDRLFARTATLAHAPTIEVLGGAIADAIAQTVAASPIPMARIDQVGVALPGAVDSRAGVLHWLQTYPGPPEPIAQIIAARLRLPVTVDNDINVVARAEHWFGEDRQLDDFSLFSVGFGLGFGQYVDGALRIGAHGMNAEISHVKLGPPEGPTCLCGAKGCLAVSATMFAAVLRVCEARARPAPDLEAIETVFRDFAREARNGDRIAAEVFAEIGRVLGVAVANHVNLADPARVLVLVRDAEFAALVAAPFYASLQENTFAPLRGKAPVQFRVVEDARYSRGVAALVLERLYRAPAQPGPLAPRGEGEEGRVFRPTRSAARSSGRRRPPASTRS